MALVLLPNAFVICITNPLDVIVMALQKYSGMPKNKIVGMAGIDSSRFIYFLSEELKIPVKNQIFVLGIRDSMVAMLNLRVNGKINDLVKEGLLKKDTLDKIVDRTKKVELK